jgi:hypothetical protein
MGDVPSRRPHACMPVRQDNLARRGVVRLDVNHDRLAPTRSILDNGTDFGCRHAWLVCQTLHRKWASLSDTGIG